MTGRSLYTSRVLAFLVLFCFAIAQPTTEQAEADLKAAIEALSNATSYHFEYSITPNVDATTLMTGEGEADTQANAWRYTVTTDPSDPSVDHSMNGEWIIVNNTHYQNTGDGWTSGGMNFTTSGITGLLAPFQSYDTLKMLGNEETFQEVTWLGQDSTYGVEADHYTFATKEMPLYGTAQFDLWIAKEGDTVTLVVLAVTPEGGLTNRVTYSKLNESVLIEAPN